MKITLHIVLLALLLTSCDFIFKDHSKDNASDLKQKPVVLGTDKDDKGCVTSAGYRWSETRNGCIRVFEEGFRLAPVQKDTVSTDLEEGRIINAYVVFNADKTEAELFLPESKSSIIMKGNEDSHRYVNADWKLSTAKSFTLSKNNVVCFISAQAIEQKFTGSDNGE